MIERIAACACARVRMKAQGASIVSAVCHCNDCQGKYGDRIPIHQYREGLPNTAGANNLENAVTATAFPGTSDDLHFTYGYTNVSLEIR